MCAREWEAFLSERLGRSVEVAYGRARTLPVRAVYGSGSMRLRLHEFFAGAPDDIRDALAAWLRSGRRARRACAALDAWIDARLEELPAASARRVRLEPRGACHDLAALADPLFAREFAADFAQRPAPGLTWGRRMRSQAHHSLRLGSYARASHVVRIHPVLDRPAVPDWFVRYLLFHEILHAALPPRTKHGPAFRARERAYPDYARAVRWQRHHIARLIRTARQPRRAEQGWLFSP